MMQILKACSNDLTRDNVMKQATSVRNLKLPLLLPGMSMNTSADDYVLIKQGRLAKVIGTQWEQFGELIGGT